MMSFCVCVIANWYNFITVKLLKGQGRFITVLDSLLFAWGNNKKLIIYNNS